MPVADHEKLMTTLTWTCWPLSTETGDGRSVDVIPLLPAVLPPVQEAGETELEQKLSRVLTPVICPSLAAVTVPFRTRVPPATEVVNVLYTFPTDGVGSVLSMIQQVLGVPAGSSQI